MSDHIIYRFTWLAVAVSLATGLVTVGAQAAKSEAGIAFALAFMLLFFFVSVPLHLGLALVSLIRGLQGARRTMDWVYAYLLVTVIVHGVVAARMGAFAGFEEDFMSWQREREQPAQVALERALMQPINIAEVRAALVAGANPNGFRPQFPVPYLIVAAMRPNVELVDALLDGGADVNIRSTVDSGGDASLSKPTAVDTAAFSEGPGRLSTVQRLLDSGADTTSSFMRLGACHHGDLDLLDLAISSGAPDMADRKGNGCLYFAAKGGHEQMVARLLADGADPNAPNMVGILPMDAALARRKYRAALALAKSGGHSTGRRVLENDPGDPDLVKLREWLKTYPQR